jgi:hypothetical protein
VLFGSLALLVLVTGVLAYLIASSQSQAHQDLQRRFRDRSKISAAVAESVFASLGSGTAAPALTPAKIDQKALDKLAAAGKNPYIVVRDGQGNVIATSSKAPASVTGALNPELHAALMSRKSLFSSVVPGPSPAKSVVLWGIPFKAVDGSKRLEVIPIPVPAMAKFLGAFLGQLPNASSATAAVLDRNGRVVGSPDKGVVAGTTYRDPELLAANRKEPAGDIGDRYFASTPVQGSTWKIAIAAPNDKLYSSINGSRRTVPWLILIVLALVGLAGLLALRRAAKAQAEVQRRAISRRAALEINDNVIQRLAVVKFALERGQEASTEAKLAEALQEAQKLVNQLLGEEGAEAGSLRRTTESPADVL